MAPLKYWTLVAEEKDDITKAIQKLQDRYARSGNPADLEGQPATATDCVLIVSIGSKKTEVCGGQVVEATLRNAAICSVNGTHRIATAEEIAQHRQEEDQRRQGYARSAAAKRAARELTTEYPAGLL